MVPSKFSLLLGVALLSASSALEGEGAKDRDWREALLAEEGIERTPEALRAALETGAPDEAQLQDLVSQLGADSFREREQAQRKLIGGGDPVYRWLRDQEPSPHPEIRERVRETLLILGSGQGKIRQDALVHAIRSLLAEGPQRRKDTGGLFHEWFSEPVPSLDGKYHGLQFENPNKRDGKVAEGCLILSGRGGRAGDQSLVLKSEEWPGKKDFGRRFRITARLGGTPGGGGAWHLGISVGQVRALFHPEYPGGGFRFSETGNDRPLSGSNADMGFTPEGGSVQTMTLDVEQLPRGKVVLAVTIRGGDQEPVDFSQKIVVPAETIGPLDRISLDRSGRDGGNAVFHEFSVEQLPDE